MNNSFLIQIIASITVVSFAIYFIIIEIKKMTIIRKSKIVLKLPKRLAFLPVFLIVLDLLFSIFVVYYSFEHSKYNTSILCNILIFFYLFRWLYESANNGFYNSGLIFPLKTYEWKVITGYQLFENRLRLTHIKKGAFEIQIDKSNYKEISTFLDSMQIQKRNDQK